MQFEHIASRQHGGTDMSVSVQGTSTPSTVGQILSSPDNGMSATSPESPDVNIDEGFDVYWLTYVTPYPAVVYQSWPNLPFL
jgi:hypothetical protein